MALSQVRLRDCVAELRLGDGGQMKYVNSQKDRAGQAPHDLPGNYAHRAKSSARGRPRMILSPTPAR